MPLRRGDSDVICFRLLSPDSFLLFTVYAAIDFSRVE
jgi:hypothetical protein